MIGDNTPIAPVVTIKAGAAVASSKDVALAFGKLHKNVLTKIDDLVEALPHLRGLNFKPMIDDVPIGKGAVRQDRCYEMDRKGFSLLAMRFTGAKALAWQDAYTDAFDRMEQALAAGHGGPVMVNSFGPEARSMFGGIVKSVTHRELQDAVVGIVSPMLDAMVTARLANSRFSLVEGVCALDVAEIAGHPKGCRPRGTAQFISVRLHRYHVDRGLPVNRSRHGSGKVLVFDEHASRQWLLAGGRAEIDHYIAKRRGQGSLTLVGASNQKKADA